VRIPPYDENGKFPGSVYETDMFFRFAKEICLKTDEIAEQLRRMRRPEFVRINKCPYPQGGASRRALRLARMPPAVCACITVDARAVQLATTATVRPTVIITTLASALTNKGC